MKKIVIISMIVLLAITISGCTSMGPTGDVVANTQQEEAQVVSLGLDRGGYLPREITVKVNKPVILRNDGTLKGCANYPVQPELGINANFAKNSDFEFTPTKKGTFTFTCGMGMWKGTINVI